MISGVDTGDRSGHSVSSAGDVNGDGFDDLIVGAPDAGEYESGAKSYDGESYVIYGTNESFGASIDLATLTPAHGFRDSRSGSGRRFRRISEFGGRRKWRRL